MRSACHEKVRCSVFRQQKLFDCSSVFYTSTGSSGSRPQPEFPEKVGLANGACNARADGGFAIRNPDICRSHWQPQRRQSGLELLAACPELSTPGLVTIWIIYACWPIAGKAPTGQPSHKVRKNPLGGLFAQLVVTPPQVAILGAGRIEDACLAQDGQPVVRRVLPLSLSFDHRVVTGGEATRFLSAVRAELERPTQGSKE